MTILIWLAALGVLLAWLVTRRIGRFAPLSLVLWFLSAVFVLAMVSGLGLAGVSLRAAAIVAVGLVGLATPALVTRRGPTLESIRYPAADRRIAWPRVLVCAVVLAGLVLIGFISFRARISGVVGTSFGNLTAQQIRAAQNGAARGGGFAALCSAATPVFACLGIYAARVYSRWWYLATVASFAVLLDSPARTSVLALGVTTLVFLLYLRHQSGPRSRSTRSRTHRARLVLLVLVALAAMLYYFESTGAATHKTDQIAATYPGFGGPAWLISPVLYFTGGLSALSVALRIHFDPFDHPNSIYLLTKLGHLLDPQLHVPNTIANYVGIPAPFNVYTGFGQLYFDFGFVGVFVMCALLGYVALLTHRQALTGRLEWAFVSAVVANILASMQLEYRLFLLDVDFQVLLGVVTFALIGRARSRRPQAAPVTPVAPVAPVAPVERLGRKASAGRGSTTELSAGWRQALGR